MEEALEWVAGDDTDRYAMLNIYFISNILSMLGFMLYLSVIFMF
jgi:hypothetical protein